MDFLIKKIIERFKEVDLMSFLTFAAKNPFRTKLRTIFIVILLVLGVIAIATSVSVSVYSTKFFGDMFNSGGADLNALGDGYLSTGDLNNLTGIKDVQSAVGVTNYEISDNTNKTLNFNGFYGANLVNNTDIPGVGHINFMSGGWDNSSTGIILTEETAKETNKKVGDTFYVSTISSNQILNLNETNPTVQSTNRTLNSDFKVVGIIKDTGSINGIVQIQGANNLLFNSTDLKFNSIYLKTNNGKLNEVETSINGTYPQYKLVVGDALINSIKSFLFYLTSFFIGLGAVIMMIATLKSVSERTREIGVLKAIGWSNRLVVGMIMVESLVQLILAWIAASVIIAILLVVLAPQFDMNVVDLIKDNTLVAVYAVLLSFGASLLMPVLGCLIPIIRVLRLNPTEALKYE
jgi:putative ABC transport system permease protein